MINAVLSLDAEGVPHWLPPTWGSTRSPGTKFYSEEDVDRIKAINADLLAALQAIAGPNHTFFRNCAEIHEDEILQARAAIAKAEAV